MDKVVAKHAMRDAGIPTPDFYAFSETAFRDLGAAKALPAIEARLDFPIVVKPAGQGSRRLTAPHRSSCRERTQFALSFGPTPSWPRNTRIDDDPSVLAPFDGATSDASSRSGTIPGHHATRGHRHQRSRRHSRRRSADGSYAPHRRRAGKW